MEDGAFSRGRDIITAEGSIVFVGNLDGDIETIVRTSQPLLPDAQGDGHGVLRPHPRLPARLGAREDARRDVHEPLRLRHRLPGRGLPRAAQDAATWTSPSATSAFGQHVGGRDQKAVRKTVTGLIKLLHPDGEVTEGGAREYVELAMEMRRRVKEQLKKMGGLEYWDISFSYIDRESGQETFVVVPESGGGSIIAEGALPPGSVYTIGTDIADNRKLALFLHPDPGEPRQRSDHPARQPVRDR